MKLMKKGLMMMLLFVVCSVSAMNEQAKGNPSVPSEDGICYLNSLLAEELDCIASFLMETEEELVERTKDLSSVRKVLGFEDFVYGYHDPYGWCPDKESYIGIPNNFEVKTRYQDDHYKQLVIKKDGVNYTGELDDKSEYQCVALSRGCNRIGIYRSEKFFCPPKESINYRYFLEIQKIELKNNEKDEDIIEFGETCKLPITIAIPELISFNKQGNLFIVCGKNIFTQKAEHAIVDLKKLMNPNLKEEVAHTNKLQTYLRDKFVCSKYIKGATNK